MKRVTRHKSAALNLPTLRLEGALFLPDVLEKAALGTARLQADADYGIPKGLKQKDEYSRAFQIASAQWKHFEKQMERTDLDATHATATFVAELLRDALAYPAVGASTGINIGDRHYPVTHIASNGLGAQLPIVVAPHTQGLDEADARFGVRHTDGQAIGGHSGTRKKSPFQLAQELLNASPDHQWAIVTNGKTIRLLRDAATLTRPSYLDIDMADLLSGQRYAEFAYAWRLLHASRAGLQSTSDQTVKQPVVWEAWREAGQEEGTRVRNGLRLGVTQALLTFGNGFLQHPANDALRMALQNGELKKEDYFAQLLRLIYRLIFVFSIEERGLLKDANGQTNAAYTQGYALARLRDMALRRRARNRFDDLWLSMRIVFKGLNLGEPRLGLPALGGLFNTSQCPALDGAELSNAHLLATMQSMRWAAQAGGSLAPIDYRNMGVEELGSVYESLLELVPEVDLPARTFGFVGLTSEGMYVASVAGNERKLTGSYYTPDSLVQELIQSALVPVIDERIAAQPDNPVEALLSIKVCDPACGSGHFLLAAARKLAERLAALRSDDGVVTPSAYRHALREVIARCIYGVDRNPMAIELARTSLWLEGFEEGRPLSFLDHHLQVGDALLGLTDLNVLDKGISGDAFKPLSGDDKEVCKELGKLNTQGRKQLERDFSQGQKLFDFSGGDAMQQALKTLDVMPADTPDQVQAKEDAYRQWLGQRQQHRLSKVANLVLAAFLLPKSKYTSALTPTSQTVHAELSETGFTHAHEQTLDHAQDVCKAASVFHWPIAFAQVYAAGGFDCVLGNPPWERIKLQEEEFFATRHPAVAAAKNKAERAQRIQWLSEGTLAKHLGAHAEPNGLFDIANPASSMLADSEKRLYAEFITARRTAEAASVFMHVSGSTTGQGGEGGRYPLTGVGDVNTYALFAETILQIKSATGRAGFIVPTGIATDDSTKLFFGHISQAGQLASLFDIENKEALFESVHRSFKFSLVTLGQSPVAEFVCFASQPSQLTDTRRRFSLTPQEFQLINPNTLTCPMFRSERDAEITKKLYRAAPVLMRDAVVEEVDGVSQVVSPGLNPWGIRFSTMFHMSNDSYLFQDQPAEGLLPLFEAKLIHQFDHRWATYTPEGDSRDMTLAEKQDPMQTARPRYWVDEREVLARVANVPARLAKAWLLTHTEGDNRNNIPVAKSLEFAVASWVAGQFMRQAMAADRTIDSLSKNEFAQTLHCAQSMLEERYPPLAETLRAADIEGAAARKAFAAWCEDDREQPLSQQELDEVEAWMRVWNSVRGEGDAAYALLKTVDDWMQRRSPKWLMGWRDITNATNERTVISAVVPLAGVGNQMPLALFPRIKDRRTIGAFYGNLCSLVFDVVARHKTGGTHMNFFIFKQLPILPPDRYTEDDLAYIVPRVLELTYTAHDLAAWAKDLGHNGPPFPFNPERRAQLRAELDAYYARLYGLTRDELRYILDPADVMGDDYPSETFRVLKNGEMREFGEYRTQRLVLAAWDQLNGVV